MCFTYSILILNGILCSALCYCSLKRQIIINNIIWLDLSVQFVAVSILNETYAWDMFIGQWIILVKGENVRHSMLLA